MLEQSLDANDGELSTTIDVADPHHPLPILGKMVLGALVAVACWALFIGLIGLPFAAFGGL